MKQEGLLRAFVLPASLTLAWQVWTATITSTLLVSATLEQCQLDCAGSTTAEMVDDIALNGGTWSVWDTQRLVGPTQPATELNATYPLAKASYPLPFHSFCQLGCSFFFAGSPKNMTFCVELCDDSYARNVSVGINDYAEKVKSCRHVGGTNGYHVLRTYERAVRKERRGVIGYLLILQTLNDNVMCACYVLALVHTKSLSFVC